MDYKKFFIEDNKSGWKCVESKLKNNHPDIHKMVVSFSEKNNLTKLSFKEKVYCFINDLKIIPTCHECGGKVKFLRLSYGYQKFCGKKCSNINKDKILITKTNLNNKYGVDTSFKIPEVIEKIKNSNLKNYGVDNVFKSKEFQKKIKETINNVYGNSNIFKTEFFKQHRVNKKSKIENLICDKLGGESGVIIGGREFDIKINDTIIEIDGEYFHPGNLIDLTLIQLNNVINDKIKDDIIANSDYILHRVKVSRLKNTNINQIDYNYIIENSYNNDYTLTYSQKIITKQYLKSYINKYGVDKLSKYLPMLLKFIRIFQENFPYPEKTEILGDVCDKIRNFDYDRFHNKNNNEFNNNTYNIGCNYLKSDFKSYWNSSYRGCESPIDIWVNDEKMLKIIAYRIGLNNSNEIFDLSLRNLVRGISAIRGTISFFKPLVAAGIYKHYLININNPIVFDPCSGFGGRLLGFKSIYPNGTYIGCEPNNDTYQELCNLGNNFSNTFIYNSKVEDFNQNIEYDIAFTSIPYFDLEDYKNGIFYNDFDEWVDVFIGKLLTYKRLIINMSYELCVKLGLDEYIDGYLTNGSTHYNKSKSSKKEVLIKLNF